MFLIGEVSRTQQIVFFFLRKLWSKACREKSADAIVVGKKKSQYNPRRAEPNN